MIQVTSVLTADNTDVLQGTDLQSIPGPGVLIVAAASTQNDTTLTITAPNNVPLLQAQRLNLRTSGVPSLQDDPVWPVIATQGGHPRISVDIVTAATVYVVSQYYDINEVAGMMAE